jgi:hypothetical protein
LIDFSKSKLRGAGQLHSHLTGAIDRFMSQHPDTLRSEVLAALASLRIAYAENVSPLDAER